MKTKHKFDLNKLFFTSDLHFFHAAVISYSNRPFRSTEEQTEVLISNWNSVVPKDGDVIMMGDFCFTGDIHRVRELIGRLNGRIWWIMGNHDYQNKLDRDIIKEIVENRQMDVLTIIPNDPEFPWNIFCSHYPHLYWQRGSVHLHGHVHSGPQATANEPMPYHYLREDVGVDNSEYFPRAYNSLKSMFLERIRAEKLNENNQIDE